MLKLHTVRLPSLVEGSYSRSQRNTAVIFTSLSVGLDIISVRLNGWMVFLRLHPICMYSVQTQYVALVSTKQRISLPSLNVNFHFGSDIITLCPRKKQRK